MTKSIASDVCDGCGQNKQISEIEGNELCQDCACIAKSLAQDPKTVERLIKLTKTGINGHSLQGEEQQKRFTGLPEVLDAVRIRTRDRDQNRWYVSISEIEGQPVEIFASTAFDRDQHLQSRISNLTTITRLISLILRHVFLGEVITLEKTLKQLHRSSRQKNDLPDMLTSVLSKYSRTSHKAKTTDSNDDAI